MSNEEYGSRYGQQNNDPNVESYTREDGKVVTYNIKENTFGVRNPPSHYSGRIFETFFRPKDGAWYYYKEYEAHLASERAFTNGGN